MNEVMWVNGKYKSLDNKKDANEHIVYKNTLIIKS